MRGAGDRLITRDVDWLLQHYLKMTARFASFGLQGIFTQFYHTSNSNIFVVVINIETLISILHIAIQIFFLRYFKNFPKPPIHIIWSKKLQIQQRTNHRYWHRNIGSHIKLTFYYNRFWIAAIHCCQWHYMDSPSSDNVDKNVCMETMFMFVSLSL